jgi:adenylate cyclase
VVRNRAPAKRIQPHGGGLRERDRLPDLFGRHVGEEVVRRAVQENESLSGDERVVAVLFVDLVGSTQLSAAREPHEVAEILNDFFRIVVAAVDNRHGLINKFQGDAALAIFGAPLRADDPASAALATARALGEALRRLPVDFGIGVSAGPVFAGTIGAENRYEYTVVGDAVNEAARRNAHSGARKAPKCCAGGLNPCRSRRPPGEPGALACRSPQMSAVGFAARSYFYRATGNAGV